MKPEAAVATRPLVVLAAGRGERMGGPKGLLEVGGVPLAVWQQQRFHAAGGRTVVCVVGEHGANYRDRCPTLSLVVNAAPERGPFSSLQCGLGAVIDQAQDGVFVLPVDVPAASPATWRRLGAACGAEIDVARACAGGRAGHPVWLSAGFCRDLLRLDWQLPEARLDHQIRALRQRQPLRVRDVETDDPTVLLNLNDASSWAAWLASLT